MLVVQDKRLLHQPSPGMQPITLNPSLGELAIESELGKNATTTVGREPDELTRRVPISNARRMRVGT